MSESYWYHVRVTCAVYFYCRVCFYASIFDVNVISCWRNEKPRIIHESSLECMTENPFENTPVVPMTSSKQQI